LVSFSPVKGLVLVFGRIRIFYLVHVRLHYANLPFMVKKNVAQTSLGLIGIILETPKGDGSCLKCLLNSIWVKVPAAVH
jgi:hypothetical protein